MSVRIKQKNPDAIKKVLARYGKGGEVALGWPEGSDAISAAYPDGTPVLLVAFWHNFGTVRVPRRDFMTPGGTKAVEATQPLAVASVKKLNRGTTTLKKTLNLLGATGAAQIGQAIVDLDTPANSKETIAAKGSSNPLVDTGFLSQSATWSIREK